MLGAGRGGGAAATRPAALRSSGAAPGGGPSSSSIRVSIVGPGSIAPRGSGPAGPGATSATTFGGSGAEARVVPSGIGAPGACGAAPGSKASPRRGPRGGGIAGVWLAIGGGAAAGGDARRGAPPRPPADSWKRNSMSSSNFRSWSLSCRFSNCSCSIWPDICRTWFSSRFRRTTKSAASCAAAGPASGRPAMRRASARKRAGIALSDKLRRGGIMAFLIPIPVQSGALFSHSRCCLALHPRPAVEHGHGAAVLRPARDVVAGRDRTLLAVGDGADARAGDAARGEVVAHHLRAAGAEREIVLAGAALVGVALDQEGVARVARQPRRLLVERRDRGRSKVGRVAFEEHPVADIDGEILGRAGRAAAAAGGAEVGSGGLVGLRAGGDRQRRGKGKRKPQGARRNRGQHGRELLHTKRLPAFRLMPSLGGLSEGSVNLDGGFIGPARKPRRTDTLREG